MHETRNPYLYSRYAYIYMNINLHLSAIFPEFGLDLRSCPLNVGRATGYLLHVWCGFEPVTVHGYGSIPWHPSEHPQNDQPSGVIICEPMDRVNMGGGS